MVVKKTKNNTKQINKYLKTEFRNEIKIKKCLLLGSGSSGKSTLFRQLKVIHGQGFDETEFIETRNVILSNCILGILTLLKKSQELYDEDNKDNYDTFIDLNLDENKYIIDDINLVKFI